MTTIKSNTNIIPEGYELKFRKSFTFLFENEYYKKLPLTAKVMYQFLFDRWEYSKKMNWTDLNGNLYMIFPNEELADLLDCSVKTVIDVKAKLEKVGLLKQERQGFKKPNRLYLLPITNYKVQDVYLSTKSKEVSSSDVPASKLPANNTLDNQKEVSVSAADTSSFDVFSAGSNVTIDVISKNSDLEASSIKKLIFKAKSLALFKNNIKSGKVFDIKYFQNFAYKTLKSVFRAMKKEKGVRNLPSYIFSSFYNGFERFAKMYHNWKDSKYFEDTVVTERLLMDYYYAQPNNSNKKASITSSGVDWNRKAKELREKYKDEPIMSHEEMDKIFNNFGKDENAPLLN